MIVPHETNNVNGAPFTCGHCDEPVHDLDRALVAWVGPSDRTCALVHAGCAEAFAARWRSAFWHRDHPRDVIRGRSGGRRPVSILSWGPEGALESMRIRLGEAD